MSPPPTSKPPPHHSILQNRVEKIHVSSERIQCVRAECPDIAIKTEWMTPQPSIIRLCLFRLFVCLFETDEFIGTQRKS